MGTTPEAIGRLWFEVTRQAWDEELFDYFTADARHSLVMRAAPLDVVAMAGRRAFLRRNSLLMPAWEEEVLFMQGALRLFEGSPSARAQGLNFTDWSQRRQAIDALDRLHGEDRLMQDLNRFYPPKTVRLARELLTERALQGEVDLHDGHLQPLRYRPHLHFPGTQSLPVISVDSVEMVILHLLSLTYPSMQFFYDGHGRPVPGFLNGYHRDNRPSAISGLSVILDAVGEIVDDHRLGTGGRVYVSRRDVVCPKHTHTIAQIEMSG